MYAAGGHLVSLDVSWNGLEDGLAPLALAIQKGGGAPLKSLNLAGTRPTHQVGPAQGKGKLREAFQPCHKPTHLISLCLSTKSFLPPC